MPLMRKVSHQGNPNHPPCVFLHGFLGAKEDWQAMWCFFAPFFFCLAFDLPGHGLSSPAISQDYLEILSKEIAQACTSRPILIGYSLGGRLALQLAQANPSAYSHVVALSAHPGLTEEKERQARVVYDLEWIDKLTSSGLESFLKEWYDQPLFHSLHKKPELFQSILEKRKNQDPQKMADVLRVLSLGHQSPIISFHPQTLFLHGDEDEKYQKLYSALPKEVFVRQVEYSGHVMHLENPEACSMHILKWMKDIL